MTLLLVILFFLVTYEQAAPIPRRDLQHYEKRSASDSHILLKRQSDFVPPTDKSVLNGGTCNLRVVMDREWIELYKGEEKSNFADIFDIAKKTFSQQLGVTLQYNADEIILDKDNEFVGERPMVNGKVKREGIMEYYEYRLGNSTKINGANYCAVVILQGSTFDKEGVAGVALRGSVCSNESSNPNKNIAVITNRDFEGDTHLSSEERILLHELGKLLHCC